MLRPARCCAQRLAEPVRSPQEKCWEIGENIYIRLSLYPALMFLFSFWLIHFHKMPNHPLNAQSVREGRSPWTGWSVLLLAMDADGQLQPGRGCGHGCCRLPPPAPAQPQLPRG